jgi:hypothetical protein
MHPRRSPLTPLLKDAAKHVKLRPVVVNPADEGTCVTWRPDGSSKEMRFWAPGNVPDASLDVAAVFNTFTWFAKPSESMETDPDEAYFRTESHACLGSALNAFAGPMFNRPTFRFNHPRRILSYQFAGHARAVGLPVQPSICTSSLDQVDRFRRRSRHGVLVYDALHEMSASCRAESDACPEPVVAVQRLAGRALRVHVVRSSTLVERSRMPWHPRVSPALRQRLGWRLLDGDFRHGPACIRLADRLGLEFCTLLFCEPRRGSPILCAVFPAGAHGGSTPHVLRELARVICAELSEPR